MGRSVQLQKTASRSNMNQLQAAPHSKLIMTPERKLH